MRECTLVTTTLLSFVIIVEIIAAVVIRSIGMSLKLLIKILIVHKEDHNRSITSTCKHHHMINH